MPAEITTEPPPSLTARVITHATHATLKNFLKIGSRVLHFPLPFELVETGARALPKPRGTTSVPVHLPHCNAQMVRARGVGRGQRAILFLHGGAFFVCGPNTHAGVISKLSTYADCPVLAVDYRMSPRHCMEKAIQDCVDGYRWLRNHYDEIVIVGDSAGGYLSLATALELTCDGDPPVGMALMSPLLQLDPEPKMAHPNIHSDAMFSAEVFPALTNLIKKANGGGLYEPLNWLTPGLPPTLIHVSGSEVLLHDAELAALRLTEVNVPVTLHIWPGQIHDFQLLAPLIPEAERSLRQIGAFVISCEKLIQNSCVNDLTKCTGTVG